MIDFPPELDTPEFHLAWAAWEAYRAKRKPKLTEASISRQLSALKAVGVAKAIAAIEESIMQGWQGVFPERQNGQGAKGSAGSLGRGRIGINQAALERSEERRKAQRAALERPGDHAASIDFDS